MFMEQVLVVSKGSSKKHHEEETGGEGGLETAPKPPERESSFET